MHENRETSETPAVKPGRRSAGEGDSRTARVDVSEESHSGILPMNYSNNDKTSSAESREGRPLIKENAGQPNTCPTQSGKGVSQGLACASQIVPTAANIPAGRPRLLRPTRTCVVTFARIGYAIRLL